MKALIVAGDLLREARYRRWFMLLAVAVTLALILLAATLRLEVVDGVLAATSFFGRNMDTDL